MRIRLLPLLSSVSLLLMAMSAAGCVITINPVDTESSGTSSSDGSGSTSPTSSEGSDTATQGSDSGTEGTSQGTTSTEGTSVGTEGTTSATEGSTGTGSTTGAETTGDVGCGGGCGAGEYCDWNANSCGEGRGDVGTCKPLPDACDAEYAPVCGCDGEVHSNACTANGGGTDVAAAGECQAPAGYYACGYRFCDQETSYCQVSYNDVQGEPDFYQCLPLPEACGKEMVCGCLEGEPCFEFECSDEGGLTLYCPGG